MTADYRALAADLYTVLLKTPVTEIPALLQAALESAAGAPRPAPTVDDLKKWCNQVAWSANALGDRVACVVMVGVPVAGTWHDRFAATAKGSCLMMRGLFARGSKMVEEIMNEAELK